MKFELKTENENYSKPIMDFLKIFISFAFIVIFCDVALKLGIISRDYQINHNCELLAVEKSKFNFKKLSRLSNLKSKLKILEFCRVIVK